MKDATETEQATFQKLTHHFNEAAEKPQTIASMFLAIGAIMAVDVGMRRQGRDAQAAIAHYMPLVK